MGCEEGRVPRSFCQLLPFHDAALIKIPRSRVFAKTRLGTMLAPYAFLCNVHFLILRLF